MPNQKQTLLVYKVPSTGSVCSIVTFAETPCGISLDQYAR